MNSESSPTKPNLANSEEPERIDEQEAEITAEEVARREQALLIGAKVLSAASFHRHTKLVESSFDKALRTKEKLPAGRGDERRNYAYLKRLQTIIDEHGSRAEKHLWGMSATNIPLIQTENITESTWESLRRDHRNHGIVDIELTPALKEAAADSYRSVQEQDLEGFTDYLSAEGCPYPLWFKIYAWDGLTRLSRSTTTNKSGQTVFRKRDSHTTSGFPKLNPAALARVYDRLCQHHGLPTDAQEMEAIPESETDRVLEQNIENATFNELYSYELSRLRKPVEVPENPEDIHGEWIEYSLEDADSLSEAANGTPWCIASPSVARNYLKYGVYGNASKDSAPTPDSKAKFYLLHLTDPETGLPSPTACASIRLGTNGAVAEISGVLGGSEQRLNPSLLPAVKEKAFSLPGGERKYQAFLDSEELTRLDKKRQAGEPFTEQELRFIFEIDRKIESITYRDGRIQELCESADVDDVYNLMIDARPSYIINILDKYLARHPDISIDEIVENIHSDNPRVITNRDNLEKLLRHGANPDLIVAKLDPKDTLRMLHTLLQFNAHIDLNELTKKLDPNAIAENLEILIDNQVDIDVEALVREVSPSLAPLFIRRFVRYINVDKIIDNLSDEGVSNSYDALIIHGHADIKKLIPRLTVDKLMNVLDSLVEQEIKIDVDNLIVEKLDSKSYVFRSMDRIKWLIECGATADKIIARINPYLVFENLPYFASVGARNIDMERVIAVLTPDKIIENLDSLINDGRAKIETILQHLDQYHIIGNLKLLLDYHANINADELLDRANPENYIEHELAPILPGHSKDKLEGESEDDWEDLDDYEYKQDQTLEYLATAIEEHDKIKLSEEDVPDRDTDPEGFTRGVESIASRGAAIIIARHIKTLVDQGASIDKIVTIITKAAPDVAIQSLDDLLSNGATIDQVVQQLDQPSIDKYRETLIAHNANLE